jgi:hypothetical protein
MTRALVIARSGSAGPRTKEARTKEARTKEARTKEARTNAQRCAVSIAILAACQGGERAPGAQGSATAQAGSPHGSGTPAAVDAGVIDANLDACKAAAARMPSLPLAQRTVPLMEACQPCGEWGPMLAWDIPIADGGPSRAAIERSLVACNAFCDSTSKSRFFAALEPARGRDTRKPWRVLGELCKDKVSAVPDTRFMSAPYVALDRVARMIGDAAPAGSIELPLPAYTISGTGVELPTSALVVPEAGPAVLTIDAAQFLLGILPVARLSASGVQVGGDYPGARVEPPGLAAALGKPPFAGQPLALVAPRELPAERIYEAVAAAGAHDVRLAVATLVLRNWIIPGTVPVALTARPPRGAGAGVRIALDDTAVEAIKAAKAAPRDKLASGPVTITVERGTTAASLANLLGALGYLDVKSVVLAKPSATPPRKP